MLAGAPSRVVHAVWWYCESVRRLWAVPPKGGDVCACAACADTTGAVAVNASSAHAQRAMLANGGRCVCIRGSGAMRRSPNVQEPSLNRNDHRVRIDHARGRRSAPVLRDSLPTISLTCRRKICARSGIRSSAVSNANGSHRHPCFHVPPCLPPVGETRYHLPPNSSFPCPVMSPGCLSSS